MTPPRHELGVVRSRGELRRGGVAPRACRRRWGARVLGV